MAQLAISAAGAAVGFVIGGPMGASIGWSMGSLLGASFGPATEGPRLSDLKVQISSYGAAIPKVYGGVQIAGNVIWARPLTERASTSGGKGGPPQTTYSYYANFAVAFSDGIVPGIRKIWFDARVVYDISEGAGAKTKAASSRFAQYFTWYDGSETQLPDPTIESFEGVGNVEAYRGTAYIVFHGVPVDGRVPNVRVETTTDTPDETDVQQLVALQVFDWEETALGPRHSRGGAMTFVVEDEAGGALATHDTFDEAYAAMLTASGGLNSHYIGYWTSTDPSGNGVMSAFNHPGGARDELLDGLGPRFVWLGFNVEPAGVIVDNGGPELDPMCATLMDQGATPDMDTNFMFSDTLGGDGKWGHAGLVRFQHTGGAALTNPGYNDITNNCINYEQSGGHFPVASLSGHTRIRIERVPTLPANACVPGDPDVLGIAEMPGDPAFCISANGDISPNYTFTPETGTFRQLLPLVAGDGLFGTVVTQYPQGPILRDTDPNYDNAAWWDARAADAGISGVYGIDYGVVVTEAGVGGATTAEVPEGSVLLADIVADICAQCGLPGGRIAVATLTDTVQGYTRTGVMSGRAALDPLRKAYYFDAVENGDVLQFVKRGGASVAALTADDLGAVEDGGEPVELVAPTRMQETELPAKVVVSYAVRAADYQAGTQQAQRSTTGSRQFETLQLPIVMTDQKGAEVADVLLNDAWSGRSERRFSTTRAWAKLLPTDVVSLDDGEFSYLVQITEKSEAGPVIQWTARDVVPAVYSPNVTPSPTAGGGGEVRFDGPIRAVLMDLPALRDDDIGSAGFYAAAGGFGGDFRGGGLYRSADDVSYALVQALNVPAVIGYATTALGDYAGGNTVDEVSAVTVTLLGDHDELAGITRAELLNDGNACMLGREVLQFQRATLVGVRTYRLTGLLRGRKGTEQHMAGHAADERFVLLDPASVYRVSQQLSDIGTAYYKAVAHGMAVADMPPSEFTNTAAALRPLSPVHLARAAISGGFAVRWVRRARGGGAWTDGTDVPLGEASEQYRVRVLDGGTVLETQTVTAPYAEVGNYPGMTVEVCQLSATVGAGFPATIEL